MDPSLYPDMGDLLYGAFDIIRALRGTPWDAVEDVLEIYRHFVKYSRWCDTLDTNVWGDGEFPDF